jgi:PAS domain S-box-containing protein
MKGKPLEQAIEDAHQRLQSLSQHAGVSSESPVVLAGALEELSTALEELGVAAEELHQQNEELVATRQIVEVERGRYQALFDFAPDGYLVTNPTGIVQEANRAASALLGVRQDFIVGKPLATFVARGDRRAFRTRLTQLRDEERVQAWEVRLQPKDCAPIHAAITVAAVRDLLGKPAGLRWLIRDITDRKQAEEVLQASETRYRRLFETAQDGILILDADTGQITDANPFLMEMLGYAQEEFLGKELWELGPFKDIAASKAAFLELQSEGYVRYEGLPLETRDGRRIDVEFVSNVYLFDHKRVIQCDIRDITKRKRAEEALQQRNRELALLNSANQTVASTLDLDHVLAVILEEARRLLNVEACRVWLVDPETDEMVCRQCAGEKSELVRGWRMAPGVGFAGWVARQGKSLIVQDALTDPRRATHFYQQTGLTVRSILSVPLWFKQSVMGALTVADPNVNRFTTADLGLVESLAAAASTAIVNAQLYERAQQEITERKQAEEALRQRTVELQTRNEELDAFAHTVAHDLKNPVGLIMGHAEMLTQDCVAAMSDEQQRSLQTIVRNGRKMNSIIEELLLLAEVRKAHVGAVPLDMASIVSEAQQRLADAVEQFHAEMVSLDVSTWPVALGYAPWVEEVWINYLSNAFRYGGRPPRLELGAEAQPDGMVRFWVRDNGAGLTPEDQARLFTPFTRLDQVQVKGHGLGLSIVRRIVEKLGGQVGVESQIGQGSMFSFTLPGVASPLGTALGVPSE